MLHCPKCKSEYDEGFTTCADCGCALEEGEAQERREKEEVKGRYMEKVLLAEALGNIQADMLTAALNNNDIPAYRESREAGMYLSVVQGFSVYGEDIYVDKADYDRAKEIMDGISLDGKAAEEQYEEYPESGLEKRLKIKKLAYRIIIIAGIAIIAMTAVVVIYEWWFGNA